MQSAAAAIEALLILFLMCAFGWVLRARRVVTPAAMPVLSAIALDVALPCLVFTVILSRFHPADMPGWHRLPLGWVLLTLAALPLSLAAGYAARLPRLHAGPAGQSFRGNCEARRLTGCPARVTFSAVLSDMNRNSTTRGDAHE